MYPYFIAVKNTSTSSGAYKLNHESASRTNTFILFCNKTRVQMFYFDYKTTGPIFCA